MDLYEWKTKNANARKYAHFDEKVSLDKVWDYISDPTNIMKRNLINLLGKTEEVI